MLRYFYFVNHKNYFREDKPTGQPDACRIHGTLVVNKVAGNFHITAGKYVSNMVLYTYRLCHFKKKL